MTIPPGMSTWFLQELSALIPFLLEWNDHSITGMEWQLHSCQLKKLVTKANKLVLFAYLIVQ